MVDKEIQRVAVVGTGLMGHGIAQCFAVKGYDVYLLSRSRDSLKKAVKEIEWSLGKLAEKGDISNHEVKTALSRICTTVSYDEALTDVDLVLEKTNTLICASSCAQTRVGPRMSSANNKPSIFFIIFY